MLLAVVLFIDGFLSPFVQVSISGVTLLKQGLVQVAQGLVRFRKLKLIGLNVRRGLPYTAKGVIVLCKPISHWPTFRSM